MALNDVIGTTDGSVPADASCAKAEMSDLCLTDTDDSNPDARRDDGCASAQRPVAPSEVISTEPRGQATYRSRSISSDGSLQRDSTRPHGLTGLTDMQTAASLDSDVTPLQVTISRQGEIEMCQAQITSADCNAVMSTRSRDTNRSDTNPLKSVTSLTSGQHPLAQLSESESDDGHAEHINPPD